jgi:serine/threonine protein kinase
MQPGVVGPYQLVRLIGQGGMANVYLARGPKGDVALKVLHEELEKLPEQVFLFEAEGSLARRISHPHLIHALDAGIVDGKHYIAFEWIFGPSLKDLISDATLPAEAAAKIVHQILTGLHYFHGLGLVHCDANPQNILCDPKGDARLGDFGVATPIGSRQSAVRGTYGYLAPEHARGLPVDARTDVFSMGVTLWELWSGRRLYDRGEPHLTLAASVEDPAPELPNKRWNGIVQKALAKDPEERFASAQAFADELLGFF